MELPQRVPFAFVRLSNFDPYGYQSDTQAQITPEERRFQEYRGFARGAPVYARSNFVIARWGSRSADTAERDLRIRYAARRGDDQEAVSILAERVDGVS